MYENILFSKLLFRMNKISLV